MNSFDVEKRRGMRLILAQEETIGNSKFGDERREILLISL